MRPRRRPREAGTSPRVRALLALAGLAVIGTVGLGILLTDRRLNHEHYARVTHGFGYGEFGCAEPEPLGVSVENGSERHLVGITVHLRAGHPERWYRSVGRLELASLGPGESVTRCFPAPPLPEGIREEGSRWSAGFGSTLVPGWMAEFL